MPELPEVETTRRGIAPHITGRTVTGVVVRQPALRWPVPADLEQHLRGQTITEVGRRAKYLLLGFPAGTLIVHLGMSGTLRILARQEPAGPHDHVDLLFDDASCLRLRDPRRFGSVLWTEDDPARHRLLRHLGPEPLGNGFHGDHLHERSRGRRVAVKQFLMDGRVVVGVGNIYACEALYLAGIHPARAAGSISLPRYRRLAEAVRERLQLAISCGGTTLRDFRGGSGRPGYFQQRLNVYGRTGEPCTRCAAPIRQIRQGQRSTFYCGRCQR
ncbi:MAG TPA: bifunctional DNA-formamidopyrimidine glycosylase/DNA-(apurinic or apyrimidinic site) lyase [Gammaproteobacteria bacterium]|nr:bifunctional DNA-formamidopyrimidine glycosylase/DNA-(apurinic or apyrimidinic site) lyase [Gammaproteobacteria bacterium]